MAALATQYITDAGTGPTYSTATASDTADVGTGSDTFLVCRNTTATAVTVSITPVGTTPYGVAWPAKTVTVPITNGERFIPLRKEYANDVNRATIVTTNVAAGVTVAVVRMA